MASCSRSRHGRCSIPAVRVRPRLTTNRRNTPVILAVRAIIFPLAAGNTVVLKSSELSPRTHFLVAELLRTAGFPAGTVNLLGRSREDAPRIMEALI